MPDNDYWYAKFCEPNSVYIPQEPCLVFNNASTLNRVSKALIDGQTFAYMAEPAPDNGMDFSASTPAVSTTCQAIGRRCNATEFSVNCSALFQGIFGIQPGWNWTIGGFMSDISEDYTLMAIWFPNSSFSTFFFPDFYDIISYDLRVWGFMPTSLITTHANPFHIAMTGQFPLRESQSISALQDNPDFWFDPEVESGDDEAGIAVYALDCEVTLTRLQYNFVNGEFLSGTTIPATQDNFTNAVLLPGHSV